MENLNLNIFKLITDFVKDLGHTYGKKYKSISLYKRIIENTTFSHEQAIQKNIDLFRQFCLQNKEAIQNRDEKLLKSPVISYSDKIFINFTDVFLSSDPESKNMIWQHILVITAYLDPSSNAKQVLKDMSEETKKKGGTGNEEKFISNIIEKLETTVNPADVKSNPATAITSILQTGVFNDLLSGMQNGIESGNLDIGKLMGVVQGMMGNIVAKDPTAAGMMGGLPDLAKMLIPPSSK